MKKAVLRSKIVAAIVGLGLAGAVSGATYTNEVAAGVTQTFTDMETELGVTISAGDTIIKKGPGILKVDSAHKIKCTVTVEEGVFHVTGLVMGNGGTVNVKKGACLYLSGSTAQMLNGWTYNVEGEGTGTDPYLGAIVVNGNNGNGQLVFGTFNLTGDATFYTCKGIINYMFSGNSATSGPTFDMKSHTLTLKGADMTAKFRARHKLTIKNSGPIIVDNMVYSRHDTTDDYTPNIPSFTLVNGAIASLNAKYISKVDAFDCAAGTSFGYTNATDPKEGTAGSIKGTLKKVIGCPNVIADTVLTIDKSFVVRGSDLVAGNKLTSVNKLTFNSGCTLDVTELGELSFSQDGATYTVATSQASISGTPTLIGDAANLFTIANTGTTLTITTKPNAGTVFLPGEENAAANTAALAAFCSGATDNMMAILSRGDYYFEGDFDLSALTAANVTICSIDNAATIHATLKLGAAANVTVSKVNFKGTTGPAVVANGTTGLLVDGCTLDSVVGAWTGGETEKHYPFVFTNVTDLEVKSPTYLPVKWKKWDAPALFSGGSQKASSMVRAGELVVDCPPDGTYGATTAGWLYWNFVTDNQGLNENGYNGLKFVKLGNGTLDPGDDLGALGITGVEIKEGQYVARDDNRLGKAKSAVKVHDGGCLCLAGGGKNIDSRTVEFEGNGVNSTQKAIRFTGSAIWNKVSSATWKLTGDATMYENVGSDSNGDFLWSAFDMGGHTLTLTGKSGGLYRFGRYCNWKGGGKMVVDGVIISASPVDDKATTPNMGSYKVSDGSHPQFVFRNKATLGPDTCELTSLMRDVDFATPDCTLRAKVGANIPHNFVFSRLAGAPIVSNVILSVSVTNNFTVHAADLKKAKTWTMDGAFVFGANTTVTLDDLTGYPKPAKTLILTAQGGITGKPKADAALKAAGWGVVKEGNSLYLDAKPGTAILVR